ncbi:MAG: hypothetical protein M3232_01815 [Thermoproteota archaeon]|nr:hypothetical protein [Thermoproteota archaeon]
MIDKCQRRFLVQYQRKIATIPNKVNADMIAEYLEYMRDNGLQSAIKIMLSRLSLAMQSFLERIQHFRILIQKNR